jgi:hypothetical protein
MSERFSGRNIKNAFSIAAEIVAPTLVADTLRARRGSKYARTSDHLGTETEVEIFGSGGATLITGDIKIGAVVYATGKFNEFLNLLDQREVLKQQKAAITES